MTGPHPTNVDGSRLEGEERDDYVRELFNEIATPYDRMNDIISLGRAGAWRRTALSWAGAAPGMRVVDLGTGTGDFFLEILEVIGEEGSVTGIDVADRMLAIAAEKAGREWPDRTHDLRTGTAVDTGLEDASVDLVTMGWVLRNIGDRTAAYREVLRILKPGGRFLCVDTSRPSSALLRAGTGLWMSAAVPLLARLGGGDVSAYRYLGKSTDRFPNAGVLAQEWTAAGFEDVRSRPFMMGAVAAHVGRRPEASHV